MVPLKQIEYGVHGNRIRIFPKPYSIYLRGTIGCGGACRLSDCPGFLKAAAYRDYKKMEIQATLED